MCYFPPVFQICVQPRQLHLQSFRKTTVASRCARQRISSTVRFLSSASAEQDRDYNASSTARKNHNEKTAVKPGEADDKLFQNGSSVHHWRSVPRATPVTLRTLLLETADTLEEDIRFNPLSKLPIYILSVMKSLYYFMLRMPLSTLSRLFMLSSAPRAMTIENPENVTRMQEAILVLMDDRLRVKEGIQQLPWDLTVRHRQFSPVFATGEAVKMAREAISIGWRMWRRAEEVERGEEVGRREEEADVWLKGEMYPPYFRTAFHYQTDGWLSSKSASVYEVLTETLFDGRQDGMQRVVFHALSPYLKSFKTHVRKAEDALYAVQVAKMAGVRSTPPVVVEVAAGTGRLATHVFHNFPFIELHVTDLSPFYLEKARENFRYYEFLSQQEQALSSRKQTTNQQVAKAFFTQADVTNLPFETGSVDVVYAIYLLHELPPEARVAFAREAARVLRGGGLLVLADSLQLGDRPLMDDGLPSFTNFKEPYYSSYVEVDIGAMFTEKGEFAARSKEICSATKMLSFVRV